jgi:hypothetical protein
LKLMNESPNPFTRFFVSDDPESFKRAGGLFLRRPIDHVETVSELYQKI